MSIVERIETDFRAIYSTGKKVKREVTVPIEEFAEV